MARAQCSNSVRDSVALLADAQLADVSAGSGLARHQADPCGELSTILECCGRTHAGDDRSRSEKTNAGNLGDSLAGRYFPHLLREPLLDQANVGLQLLNSPELLVQAVHEHRRKPCPRVAHGVGQRVEQCGMTFRQLDAELVEQPLELVGLDDDGLHELRAHPVQR